MDSKDFGSATEKPASDVELGQVSADPSAALQRGLKPRHLQMIAIGGVIGTGLFLGTAKNLQNGGPAGLLLSYLIMSSLLFSVMSVLGEMVSQFPLPGGQFALAHRFVSPELGFAMGWLFWYNYVIALATELSAAAVLVTYWTQPSDTCTSGVCNNALWVGLMLLVVYCINFAGTRVYGEIEFWFCSIKVVTIIGLIILGVIITSGGGPNHQAIGFKYWNETGGFVQYHDIPGAKGRFLGFFSVLISAAFAFIGSEITAIAAAETASPRRAVPTAIKGVWIRLVLFYVISAFIIGLLVSPSDPSLNLGSTAAKSPFVIAIKNAGIPTLPSIINAVLLSSAWSSGCASLYISSRTLYGISTRGHAPVFLQKTRSDGLPWITVLIGALFGLLAFMASSPGSAGRVFGYFADMAAICGMISWSGIFWTYLRWHKGLQVQNIDRSTLAYRAPWQPYLSYYGLAISLLVMVFGGFTAFIPIFNVSQFISTYFPIPFFVVLFTGYKFWTKSKMVPYEQMDFVTGASSQIPTGPSPDSLWKKIKDNI